MMSQIRPTLQKGVVKNVASQSVTARSGQARDVSSDTINGPSWQCRLVFQGCHHAWPRAYLTSSLGDQVDGRQMNNITSVRRYFKGWINRDADAILASLTVAPIRTRRRLSLFSGKRSARMCRASG